MLLKVNIRTQFKSRENFNFNSQMPFPEYKLQVVLFYSLEPLID